MSMDKLTAELIAHPVAVEFVGQLPADTGADAIRDNFLRFLQLGDYQSQCFALALEYHARLVVQSQFHVPAWRECVAAIDEALNENVRCGRTGRRLKNATRRRRILDAGPSTAAA